VTAFRPVPLTGFARRPADELVTRATAFAEELHRRRTVRMFSPAPVPREVIEQCVWAACSAPSGAHRQPWRFVAVGDPATKQRIRHAAEEEERAFYGGRAPDAWLGALAPFGTDAEKPFLEVAPWLIAVFAERYGVAADGARVENYYVQESVGIASGLLLAALHHAGLATLTHTPSPMGFLNAICERPPNERPFVLLVCGFPAEDCVVPDITRRPVAGSLTWR
jgi:nitroreductase